MPNRRPVPTQTTMGSRRRIITMLAIALGGFGIGTTEFVAMGLLNLIAEDRHLRLRPRRGGGRTADHHADQYCATPPTGAGAHGRLHDR